MAPIKAPPPRRRFLTLTTTVVGLIGAVGAAVPFVASWRPSAKTKASGAPVKVNVSKLEPGQMVVLEWRGKPVYVVRRTPAMLSSLEKLTDQLRDPYSKRRQQPEYITGIERSLNPEFLIVVGVCTHLGCAPKYRPDVESEDLGPEWLGGFFCPCHGSRFDLAGRVFKGVSAPSNLVIPPYTFETNEVAVIGIDRVSALSDLQPLSKPIYQ
ncbi:ubiquinol-cytochrome c reductase iron-sulfur subunit [Amphritea sp. HPY]|uniref:ubiquinol-cytochrome c reductase iron-sulfur subunit n=1 Tax=Amphritea sp. HPY TaxID=3421652 RepID=UPI003D7E81FC